jgi:hypothetical protein
MNVLIIVFVVLLVSVVFAGGIALASWLVMVCWNVLAPSFNGPELGYWPCVAVVVLLSIIGGMFRSTVTKKEAA